MAGLMVAGAFLTPVIQVIVESVASGDYKDLFIKRSVNKLKIRLNSIQKVLDDAETKQYHDERVKFWLDSLKHVVYEVEQLLDEIATSAQRKSRVHLFRLVGRFKYKINDLLDNLKVLLDDKDLLDLKEGIFTHNELSERVPTTSLVDESSKYGRQGEKEEIISFLLLDNGSSSSNQAPIISIVGLGGMGKTTLAQLVYKDDRVQKKFDLKAWVYVSESFDVIGLTKAILESFGSSPNTENLDILQCQLQEKITGKKCLLVLDDIWKVDWESCEKLLSFFNKGSSGSKVIVTTRNKKNASAMESKFFELSQLGESDSWSLFERHAFPNKKGSEYPDLEPIGKRIVGKCGGLPLAVITMGKLLREKFSQSEWIEISENDMWGLSEKETGINPVLRLGYHNLPSNLKPCFAFCSIFPKGYKFDKNKLIKMWMANGLLNSFKSDKSKEKLGNELFNVLESISFFQRSLGFDGRFIMHDLVNDLAKSVSGAFCLQVEDDKRLNHISKWTRHIWFNFDSEDGDRILKHTYRSKGLHSLLVEQKRFKWTQISNSVQCDIFSKLKYLRMLSFSGSRNSLTKLQLELTEEIGNLKLLRYLDVSWTSIERLPDSICKLYNLETLILEGCSNLTEFPLDFCKLDHLRHLNLEGTAIKKMPKNIRKLNHLQTLTNFVVGESSGSGIEELGSLNLLQGKLCLSRLNNVTDPTHAVKSRLQDKNFLEEIHMRFDFSRMESNVSVLDALQPNNNLKRLTIQNYKGNMFPNWLTGYDLPNLISLKLQHCNGIKIFGNNSTNVPFKFLEVLELNWLSEWEESLCIEAFPRLKELSITGCPKLKRAFPPHLPSHLPSLQKLVITHCEMLDVSILNYDKIIELDLGYCKRILINELSSSLKDFRVVGNQYAEFSMEDLIKNPNLEVLVLDFKDFVECPSMDLCCYNSLSELSIRGWKFSSLPFSLHLFTSLTHLDIEDCPELESFPMGGFPSNLIELEIYNCPKLVAFREGWGLLHLNSLNLIDFSNCPILESLPEEGLPNSLSSLYIFNCPLLEEKYKREGGERWNTISHIPRLYIGGSG